ncbi:hypothetical protein MIR68_003157 [Amoeboaphelidium protococcarum]|nr:hypothetical protein MIR68_003157 [Amoeboaphelidium protococcarum]
MLATYLLYITLANIIAVQSFSYSALFLTRMVGDQNIPLYDNVEQYTLCKDDIDQLVSFEYFIHQGATSFDGYNGMNYLVMDLSRFIEHLASGRANFPEVDQYVNCLNPLMRLRFPGYVGRMQVVHIQYLNPLIGGDWQSLQNFGMILYKILTMVVIDQDLSLQSVPVSSYESLKLIDLVPSVVLAEQLPRYLASYQNAFYPILVLQHLQSSRYFEYVNVLARLYFYATVKSEDYMVKILFQQWIKSMSMEDLTNVMQVYVQFIIKEDYDRNLPQVLKMLQAISTLYWQYKDKVLLNQVPLSCIISNMETSEVPDYVKFGFRLLFNSRNLNIYNVDFLVSVYQKMPVDRLADNFSNVFGNHQVYIKLPVRHQVLLASHLRVPYEWVSENVFQQIPYEKRFLLVANVLVGPDQQIANIGALTNNFYLRLESGQFDQSMVKLLSDHYISHTTGKVKMRLIDTQIKKCYKHVNSLQQSNLNAGLNDWLYAQMFCAILDRIKSLDNFEASYSSNSNKEVLPRSTSDPALYAFMMQIKTDEV